MFSSAAFVFLLFATFSGLGESRRHRIGNNLETLKFRCPEEFGYYPNPHNCALYYVCVFGGALLESCTGGLMYSQELQTCDWPRNVVCDISSSPTISTVKITDPRTSSQSAVKPSLTDLTSNTKTGSSSTSKKPATTSYSDDYLQPLPQSRKTSETADPTYDDLNQYLLEDFTLSEDKSGLRNGRLYRSQSQKQEQPLNQQVAASTVSSPSRVTPVRSRQYSSRPKEGGNYDPYQKQPPRPNYVYQQTTTTTTTTTTPDPYDYTNGYYYNASGFYYYDDEYGSPFEYYEDVDKNSETVANKPSDTSGSTANTQSTGAYLTNEDKSSQYQLQPATQDIYSNYNKQDTYIYPQEQSRSQAPKVPEKSQIYQQNDQQYSSITTTLPKVQSQPQQRVPAKTKADPVPIYTRIPARTQLPVTRDPKYTTRVTDAFSSILQPQSGGSNSNSIANNDVTPYPSRRRVTGRGKSRAQLRKEAVISNNVVNGNTYKSTRGRTPSRGHSNRNRARPTLKPASTIVRERPPIDVSISVPSRPAPLYPQPPVDQPATRCSPDVCKLPDCYCGKGAVPGGFSPTQIPQMVLLTFDDAVNDLNKELYHDLFETGRKNPNGCPIQATFYVSHEWTDYGQVQNLYADGHEIASHSITHSFGEQFSEKKWKYEIDGMRDILAAYGGVHREDVRGMRAPFLAIGGNRMFKMLYNNNYTYDSSMPVYENRPPSWPYTLDYKVFHDCMIPPCPTKSYPGVWEVPMVMWQDLNGGRCSMGDGCSAPPTAEGIYQMLIKNFERHYTTNRAPFGLFYHAAWFTKEHHKAGFEAFLDTIVEMPDVWLVTNWQALQWVRNPTPLNAVNTFEPFSCSYPERPRKCKRSKVCNLWHKSGVRYMRTCQKCPEIYPWIGKTGVYKSTN